MTKNICKECARSAHQEGDDPTVQHCPQRCANQGKAYSVCDCMCMFPDYHMAEQVAYEYRYNL